MPAIPQSIAALPSSYIGTTPRPYWVSDDSYFSTWATWTEPQRQYGTVQLSHDVPLTGASRFAVDGTMVSIALLNDSRAVLQTNNMTFVVYATLALAKTAATTELTAHGGPA